MDIKTLTDYVGHGESDVLEFKKSTANLPKAGKTLCAFLNHRGGRVIIGVTDEGLLVGQDIKDSTKLDIANMIKRFEPHAGINIEYVKLESGKYIIVLQAQLDKSNIPYTYDGRAYERIESLTQKMDQVRYQQLLLERMQHSDGWEDLPAKVNDTASLDYNLIKEVIKRGVEADRIPASAVGESIETILEKRFDMIKASGLTNAAMVLFGKDVQRYYPQCYLKLGRFKGINSLGDIIDSHQLHGNAFELLNAALTFISRHLPVASHFEKDSIERVDTPGLPVLAIREALINAICHRDYIDVKGEMSVSIFDDRIEIWNRGSLPSDLTIDDLFAPHPSIRRNKKIAKIFYYAKYIDQWGLGTLKIVQLCNESGLPTPVFAEQFGGFLIRMFLQEPLNDIRGRIDSLTERQQEILSALAPISPATLGDIKEALKNPPAERTLQDDFAKLKALGFIQSQGHGRGAKWSLLIDFNTKTPK